MMSVIESKGFKLGSLYIPPFELKKGEYLSLNFPDKYDPEKEKEIADIVAGKKRESTVKTLDLITYVSTDFKLSFFNRLLRFKRLGSFLKRDNNLSDDYVNLLLKNIQLNKDHNLFALGFNERMLLALEVAYSKTNNVIVNCAGMDYTGISKFRSRVISKLPEGTVIEFNFLTSRGREYLLKKEQCTAWKTIDATLI